eukprot:jgi/Tetstr1/420478/TSEL_011591.t1
MMENDLTWNKYRCRLYYDGHREEILAKRKLAYQKKRETTEPSRPPGRPKRARPTVKELIAELKKSSDDRLEVRYGKKLFDKDGEAHGRDYSSLPLSFQNLHRPIRNALVNHYIKTSGKRVVDIDVVNAHPVMFIQLCERYDIDADFSAIERYIAHRKPVLDMIQRDFGCDYEKAKMLPLAVFNYGDVAAWAYRNGLDIDINALKDTEAHRYISEFIDQHRVCVTELMALSPPLVSLAKHSLAKDEKPINKKAIAKRFIHAMLTISEDQVLYSMIDYITANHDTVIVSKMYDGCIVQCEADIDMSALKRHVEEQTEFVLDFVVKPFTTPISIPTVLPDLPDFSDDVDDLARNYDHHIAALFCKKVIGDSIIHLSDGFGWFMFQQPRWFAVSDVQVRKLIISEVAPLVSGRLEALGAESRQLVKILENNKEDEATGEHLKLLALTSKEVGKLLKTLNTTSHQSNIITQLTSMYEEAGRGREWYQSLDSNKHLIGFEDGVYDLATKSFRDGRPDDLISMSCGHRIADVRTEDQAVRSEILGVLRDMMPSEEEFDLMFSTLATGAFGYTVNDSFNIWVGPGGNGKGVVKALCAATFGGYFLEANTNTFLKHHQKASPTAPTPHVVALDKKRCVMSSEANSDDEIDIAFMKAVTGGDRLQARDLNKSLISVSIHSTFVLMFNAVPSVQDDSDGIKRRLRMLEFPFRYVDAPADSNEKQIDYSLRDRFAADNYGAQFMGMCIERFNHTGLQFPIPDSCAQLAQAFLGENDVFGAFMREFYEVTQERRERIKPNEILQFLKSNNTYQDQLKITRLQDLCSRLRNKGYKVIPTDGYNRVNVKRKAEFIED